MSNNKSIHILRAESVNDNNKTIKLEAGLPFYNALKNYLTIGNANNNNKEVSGNPITVPTVEGYFEDNNGITNLTSNNYKIFNNNGNSLNIESSKDITVISNKNVSIEVPTDNAIDLKSGSASLQVKNDRIIANAPIELQNEDVRLEDTTEIIENQTVINLPEDVAVGAVASAIQIEGNSGMNRNLFKGDVDSDGKYHSRTKIPTTIVNDDYTTTNSWYKGEGEDVDYAYKDYDISLLANAQYSQCFYVHDYMLNTHYNVIKVVYYNGDNPATSAVNVSYNSDEDTSIEFNSATTFPINKLVTITPKADISKMRLYVKVKDTNFWMTGGAAHIKPQISVLIQPQDNDQEKYTTKILGYGKDDFDNEFMRYPHTSYDKYSDLDEDNIFNFAGITRRSDNLLKDNQLTLSITANDISVAKNGDNIKVTLPQSSTGYIKINLSAGDYYFNAQLSINGNFPCFSDALGLYLSDADGAHIANTPVGAVLNGSILENNDKCSLHLSKYQASRIRKYHLYFNGNLNYSIKGWQNLINNEATWNAFWDTEKNLIKDEGEGILKTWIVAQLNNSKIRCTLTKNATRFTITGLKRPSIYLSHISKYYPFIGNPINLEEYDYLNLGDIYSNVVHQTQKYTFEATDLNESNFENYYRWHYSSSEDLAELIRKGIIAIVPKNLITPPLKDDSNYRGIGKANYLQTYSKDSDISDLNPVFDSYKSANRTCIKILNGTIYLIFKFTPPDTITSDDDFLLKTYLNNNVKSKIIELLKSFPSNLEVVYKSEPKYFSVPHIGNEFLCYDKYQDCVISTADNVGVGLNPNSITIKFPKLTDTRNAATRGFVYDLCNTKINKAGDIMEGSLESLQQFVAPRYVIDNKYLLDTSQGLAVSKLNKEVNNSDASSALSLVKDFFYPNPTNLTSETDLTEQQRNTVSRSVIQFQSDGTVSWDSNPVQRSYIYSSLPSYLYVLNKEGIYIKQYKYTVSRGNDNPSAFTIANNAGEYERSVENNNYIYKYVGYDELGNLQGDYKLISTPNSNYKKEYVVSVNGRVLLEHKRKIDDEDLGTGNITEAILDVDTIKSSKNKLNINGLTNINGALEIEGNDGHSRIDLHNPSDQTEDDYFARITQQGDSGLTLKSFANYISDSETDGHLPINFEGSVFNFNKDKDNCVAFIDNNGNVNAGGKVEGTSLSIVASKDNTIAAGEGLALQRQAIRSNSKNTLQYIDFYHYTNGSDTFNGHKRLSLQQNYDTTSKKYTSDPFFQMDTSLYITSGNINVPKLTLQGNNTSSDINYASGGISIKQHLHFTYDNGSYITCGTDTSKKFYFYNIDGLTAFNVSAHDRTILLGITKDEKTFLWYKHKTGEDTATQFDVMWVDANDKISLKTDSLTIGDKSVHLYAIDIKVVGRHIIGNAEYGYFFGRFYSTSKPDGLSTSSTVTYRHSNNNKKTTYLLFINWLANNLNLIKFEGTIDTTGGLDNNFSYIDVADTNFDVTSGKVPLQVSSTNRVGNSFLMYSDTSKVYGKYTYDTNLLLTLFIGCVGDNSKDSVTEQPLIVFTPIMNSDCGDYVWVKCTQLF